MYTGYVGQYIGMLIMFPSLPFALVLVAWWVMMLDRMRQEEAVLGATFPEYAAYRRRVGALGTWPLRRPARPQPAASV